MVPPQWTFTVSPPQPSPSRVSLEEPFRNTWCSSWQLFPYHSSPTPLYGGPPPGFHASVPKPQFITHDPRFQSQLPCGPSHSSPFKPPRSRSPHNESISSVSIICVSLLYGHGVYVGGSLPTCERCTILVPWCVPNVVSPTHTRQPLQVNLFECGVVFPYQ
jgi:hypothetical protein